MPYSNTVITRSVPSTGQYYITDGFANTWMATWTATPPNVGYPITITPQQINGICLGSLTYTFYTGDAASIPLGAAVPGWTVGPGGSIDLMIRQPFPIGQPSGLAITVSGSSSVESLVAEYNNFGQVLTTSSNVTPITTTIRTDYYGASYEFLGSTTTTVTSGVRFSWSIVQRDIDHYNYGPSGHRYAIAPGVKTNVSQLARNWNNYVEKNNDYALEYAWELTETTDSTVAGTPPDGVYYYTHTIVSHSVSSISFSISDIIWDFTYSAFVEYDPEANCHDANVSITVHSTSVPKDGDHGGRKPLAKDGKVYYWYVANGGMIFIPPTYDTNTVLSTTLVLGAVTEFSNGQTDNVVVIGTEWYRSVQEPDITLQEYPTDINGYSYATFGTYNATFTVNGVVNVATIDVGQVITIDWAATCPVDGNIAGPPHFYTVPIGTTEVTPSNDGYSPVVYDNQTYEAHSGYGNGNKTITLFGSISTSAGQLFGFSWDTPYPFPSPGTNWPPGSGLGSPNPTVFAGNTAASPGLTLEDLRANGSMSLTITGVAQAKAWISAVNANTYYSGGWPDFGAPDAGGSSGNVTVGLSNFTATVYYNPLVANGYYAENVLSHTYTNQIRVWNGAADAAAFNIPDLSWEGTTYTFANNESTGHFVDWSFDDEAMYILVAYDTASWGGGPYAVWKASWSGDVVLFGKPFVPNPDSGSWASNMDSIQPATILASGGNVYVGGTRLPGGWYQPGNPCILTLPTNASQGSAWTDAYIDLTTPGIVETLTGTANSTKQYAGVRLTYLWSYTLVSVTPTYWINVKTTDNTTPSTGKTISGIWAKDDAALICENVYGTHNEFWYTADGGTDWRLLVRCTDYIQVLGGLPYQNMVLFPVHLLYSDTLAFGALVYPTPNVADVVFSTDVNKTMMWGGPWFGETDGSGFVKWGGSPRGALSQAELEVPVEYVPGPPTVVTTITGENLGGWLEFSDGGMLNGWDETYGVLGGPYTGSASIGGLWDVITDTGDIHVQGFAPCTLGEITNVTVRVNGTVTMYIPPLWEGVGPEPPWWGQFVVYDRIWSLPDGVNLGGGEFSTDVDVTAQWLGQVASGIWLGLSYQVGVYPYTGGFGSAPGGFIPTITVDSIVVSITVNPL